MPPPVALSVKQPWAALLVAGVKTVEVRTWPTRRRGPVLIHAGRIPDDRPEAWELVTDPTVFELARLRGGIVGAAELADCRAYETAGAFAADGPAHLNLAAWFRPPRLYGFVFRAARAVPFYPYPGRTLFFSVDGSAGPVGGDTAAGFGENGGPPGGRRASPTGEGPSPP